MIDFANKAITTKSDLESEQLLKKAVAQGFGLPKGEKALITNRFFRFIGSPYKQILIPATISHAEFDQAISYTDLFGDPEAELRKIVDSATRWCRAYGYEHLSIFANEGIDKFSGKGLAKAPEGIIQRVDVDVMKPRKITIAELEKQLGCLIEIVS